MLRAERATFAVTDVLEKLNAVTVEVAQL